MRLSGTTVLVTGASSGLGRAMATAFVEAGAHVICSSRTESRLNEAVGSMHGPEEALAVVADVRLPDSVAEMIRTAREAHGSIDVLVNNAGVTQETVTGDPERRTVDSLSVETWDTVLETNLRGAFLCTHAILPGMLERNEGRIVHISSGMGGEGRARYAPYVASKFGLEGFHESLALELAETGVSTHTFRPPRGGVFTESRRLDGQAPDDYSHGVDIVAEPAVRLLADDPENGGRYVATEDGDGYVEYER